MRLSCETASSTLQGIMLVPLILTKGPSDSVKTRSRGIRFTSDRPLSPTNIAQPMLNQHPMLTARSRSCKLPENQCNTGVPAFGNAVSESNTAPLARRLWIEITRPPASEQLLKMCSKTLSWASQVGLYSLPPSSPTSPTYRVAFRVSSNKGNSNSRSPAS